MASIQEAVVAYLEANVSEAGKGYPLLTPPDADYPSWTYELIDDEQVIAHDGGTGLYLARLQIEMISQKTAIEGAYELAAGYAAQMKAALDGFRGTMGSIPVHFCRTTRSDDYGELKEQPSVKFDLLVTYRLS